MSYNNILWFDDFPVEISKIPNNSKIVINGNVCYVLYCLVISTSDVF